MTSDLVFPDGVRLAHLDELPGTEHDRAQAWSLIRGAKIRAGFVVLESTDPRFAFYGEANVDAPKIWSVFRDLCERLLAPPVSLVMGEIDDDPAPVGKSNVSFILQHLEPHGYQLAHDGFLQFGLVDQERGQINEVFVTPTKHFKMWFQDATLLRLIMQQHGVPEVTTLRFIDEYPRTTTRLPAEKTLFKSPDEMIRHMEKILAERRDG